MRLWKFPLMQRIIALDGSVGMYHFGKTKLMELDHVGFFLRYEKEEDVTPDYIRRHLHWRERTWALVDAPNITQAINTFYNEWEGAKTGGNHEEAKALWIDREEEIIEIPYCNLLNTSKDKRYICGEEAFNGNGEFGMCILENYDAPDSCAIGDYYNLLYELEQAKCLPVKTIAVRGMKFRYVTVSQARVIRNIRQQEQQVLVVQK